MSVSLHEFADRDSLAARLAADVAAKLAAALAAQGGATLAVSGGTTPARFLEQLSHTAVAWEKVTVTLVDEREVAETSTRSNARLVRTTLLRGPAAAANFVPLLHNEAVAAALKPDVVVLGMGVDGHTASFFPGGDTLAEALDAKAGKRLIGLAAPGAGEPRLTFTLPVLLGARALFLHIEGAEKRAVLQRAMGEGPVAELPVRAVLRHAARLAVYWCP